MDILQKHSNGKVKLQDERFYLQPGTQAKPEFNLVAEGLRKIALLWQLIKNGTLEKLSNEFELLEHNTIMDTFRQLYREEIGVE